MAKILFFILLIICLILYLYKRDLFTYVFVFLYPILPEYFAIKIAENLPLMTFSRCLIIMLIIFTVLREKKISFKTIINAGFSKILILFLFLETLNVIIHINIAENVKEYLGIIIENIFLIVFVTMNIDTQEKKEKCIKTLVLSCGLVCLCAIIEPFLKINLASTFLNTKESDTVLNVSYERMGFNRVVFSFGHPISFAVYIIMLIPIIMYCIDKYNALLYKGIFLVAVIALLLTMSRGQIIIGVCLLTLIFTTMKQGERKKYFGIIILSILGSILILLVNSDFFEMFINIIYSVLNVFGFNKEISNFGKNSDGLSRFDQLTMLPQVLDKYLFFGGGAGYIERNAVYVITEERKYRAVSIDCQYIADLISKGIVGFSNYVILYISLLKKYFNKNNKTKLSRALFFSILSAITSYITVCQLTTNRIFWIIACFILIETYSNKIINEKLNEGE